MDSQITFPMNQTILVIISFASVLCVPTHFPNIVNTFSYMFKIF